MYDISPLLAIPKYHRTYLAGAGVPVASAGDRDDWHRREFEQNRRRQKVAQAAEKKTDK